MVEVVVRWNERFFPNKSVRVVHHIYDRE
jgi:hypothetical protein